MPRVLTEACKTHPGFPEITFETLHKAPAKKQTLGTSGDKHCIWNPAALRDPLAQVLHNRLSRKAMSQEAGCVYKPDVVPPPDNTMVLKCTCNVDEFPELSSY